jgi:hypothetical protein
LKEFDKMGSLLQFPSRAKGSNADWFATQIAAFTSASMLAMASMTVAAGAGLDTVQTYDDVKELSGLTVGAEGSVIAVGEPRTVARVGQETVLFKVKPDLTLERLAIVEAPRPPQGKKILGMSAKGVLALKNGNLVVYGNVEVGTAPAATLAGAAFEGWAALVSSDGRTTWSKIWPDAASGLKQEIFYFATIASGGKLLLGGKRQKGSACADQARGVLLWVDIDTGAPSSPVPTATAKRYLYGEAQRQGFRAATTDSDGGLRLVGWASGKPGQDGKCSDAPLVATIDSQGNAQSWQVFAAIEGSLVGIAGGASAQMAALNAVRTPGSEIAQSLAFVDWIYPRLVGRREMTLSSQPIGKVTATAPLTSGEGMISAGRIDATHAWLSVQNTDGACLGGTSAEIPGNAYSDALPEGVVQDPIGSIFVVGTAFNTTSKRATGWLLRLGATPSGVTEPQDFGMLAPNDRRFRILAPTDERRATVSLELTAPARLKANLYSVVNDSDLLLLDGNNTALAISDNELPPGGGTTLPADDVEMTLPAGRYQLAAISDAPSAIAHLQVEIESVGPASGQPLVLATPVLAGANAMRSTLAVEALASMGYSTNEVEPEIGLDARVSRAIKGFQASLCAPATGELSDVQARELSASRSRALLGRAGDAKLASARLASFSLSGSSMTVETGGLDDKIRSKAAINVADFNGPVRIRGTQGILWVSELTHGSLADQAIGVGDDGSVFVGDINALYNEKGTLDGIQASHGLRFSADGASQAIGSLGEGQGSMPKATTFCKACRWEIK